MEFEFGFQGKIIGEMGPVIWVIMDSVMNYDGHKSTESVGHLDCSFWSVNW